MPYSYRSLHSTEIVLLKVQNDYCLFLQTVALDTIDDQILLVRKIELFRSQHPAFTAQCIVYQDT